MADLRIVYLLLFCFSTLSWSASMRLPSFPLAVKSPYLSVWMPGHLSDNFPNSTAQFWNGQSLTWVVLARIDETTYCLLGCPGGRPGTVQATQKSINFTSTHTYVDLNAGSTSITLDFFSPVDPYDHVRQSLPYSYLTVSANTDATYQTDVDVLTAIDASWLNDRGTPYAEYSAVNGSKILKLNGEQGREFSERGQMALWGDVVLATKDAATSTLTSCQVGSVSSFLLTGSLINGLKMDGEEIIAACAKTLKPDDTQTVATFAVGLQQDDQIQYFDGSKLEKWAGYFRSKVSTVEEAVEYFFNDFDDASAQSKEFDKKVVELGKKTSSNYSDLLEFSVRQSFGGQQVVINSDTLDTDTPYSFIKEISTDGNVNTLADLIPKALPIFHVLNPEYTRMFLEPVLRFSVDGWPLNHAVHDIGKSYPNATGENPCIEEFLPLDSSTVLLWMLYLYQNTTGNKDMTTTYAGILQRYADYTVKYGLYPVLQRSSVDQIGSAVNQSALSISAAIALNGYGKMTGQSNYSDIGIDYAKSILEVGRDSNKTHFMNHYDDQDESFVLAYPLAFDILMGLDTFPSWVHDMQSAWYRKNFRPFGIQFSNQVPYTLMEFQTWAAAVSSDDVRHHVVDTMHRFLDQETDEIYSVPGPSQWRVLPGDSEGLWTRFSKAKSVIGSLFMIAAIDQSKSNSSQGSLQTPSVPKPALSPASSDLEGQAAIMNVHLELKRSLDSDVADIPYLVPDGASKPVDPSFLGLSIDTASFPAYMGNLTSPNELSIDLITNIIRTLGAPLHIRIGGPAGDHSIYNPNQTMAIEQMGTEGQSDTTSLGPSFFEGIGVFDTKYDIRWAYQVPFATLNATNAIESTAKAIDAIQEGRVSSLEIGHKPNRYAGVHRPENYGCQRYAAELFKLQVALRRNIRRVNRQFQALALSSHQIDDTWSMEECFEAGINTQQTLRSVSMHYSQLNSTSDLKGFNIPSHSAIRTEHENIIPQASYVRDLYPCFPFVVSEASLVAPTTEDHVSTASTSDDQSSLELSMWNLDFLLYSMAQNVSRVHMHQSCNSISSAWTPNTCPDAKSVRGSAGEVNAPYFALTYIASFLNGVRDFRVVPIQESDETVIYAGYDSGKLSRIAIVSRSGDNDLRDTHNSKRTIEVQVPPEVAYVHQTARLNLATVQFHGESTSGDQQMPKYAQVPMGGKPVTDLTLDSGVLSLTTDRTEAVLLEIVRSGP